MVVWVRVPEIRVYLNPESDPESVQSLCPFATSCSANPHLRFDSCKVCFVQITPYLYYFCEEYDCKALDCSSRHNNVLPIRYFTARMRFGYDKEIIGTFVDLETEGYFQFWPSDGAKSRRRY
ncbi:hypothetical protein WN944_022795 [Citrus x changshan-huyou]|uniref:Uncharacterized protein n=1 Tax=Citrus x changshan-huyou TaxID=2935761 RepID=A0AAP0R0M6_9ROSI